ncbi:transposase family protein [Rhodococcus sp. IEGM 1379]|uniref:transposase family protein n=1 Tax=Rhodococcus sp. IEGM 1379 TaxID=3047086 RepID=UPI0024B8286E|nr:transposase family protein [Rhodococcus sp. IEGM 1379]MDI9918178.1 transposase family protein [Rhodococcus sp. IEGM 1379]
MYSGKHKTTGVNVQVACDLDGRLAWVSDPVPGRRHDSAALDLSGVLETLDPQNWIGGKGYIGKNMITPIRKPPRGDLTEKQKNFNTSVHVIRWRIEQVIAHLKTWRILHVDYRRPLAPFEKTIAAVIGLHFFRMAAE